MRIVLLLLVATFAGCVANEPTIDSVEAPYGAKPIPAEEPHEESRSEKIRAEGERTDARTDGTRSDASNIGAATAGPDRDDWFYMPLAASEEGAIRAFSLTVPDGADVPAWYDEKQRVVWLEYAFLENPALESWAILVVDMDAGRLLTAASGVASQGSANFGSGHGSPAGDRQQGSGADPDYIDLDIQAGTRLGIVVAAKGDGVADLGMRFLDADPWSDDGYDWPSDDGGEFLSRVDGENAWSPKQTGMGSGLSVDLFLDWEGLLLIPFDFRYVAGDMQVEETLPNTGLQPIDALKATAASDAGDGFTFALASRWSGIAAGEMTYELQPRDGEPLQGTTPIEPNPVGSLATFAAMGDGVGPSSATLELTAVGVPPVFSEITTLDHLALDVSLESLLGIPVEDQSFGYATGVGADNIDRDRLVIEVDGFQRIIAGLPF